MLRDAIALAVTFGLTGWLLGLAVLPAPLGPATRTGVSLALAVPATALAVAPGAALGDLGAASFLAAVAGLAVAAAWRVRHGGERRCAVRPLAWPLARRAHAALALAAVGVAVAAVLVPQVDVTPGHAVNGPAVYYYWRLVGDVLAHGQVPSTIAEWGAARPFPSEYLLFTLHGAATAALAGGAGLGLLEHYRVAVVVLGFVSIFALWRRWLPTWWAWLAAVLTLSAAHERWLSYRPETFTLLLVAWSGWLLDHALQRRSPRWAALAGIVSASGLLAHAEGWLITGPLWLGIVLSRAPMRRALAAPLAVAVLAFVVAVAATGLGVDRGARLAQLVGGDRSVAAAPAIPGVRDATWALNAAAFHPRRVTQRPPRRLCRASFLVDRVFVGFERFGLHDAVGEALVAAGALVVLASSAFAPARARRGVVTWAVFGAGTLAIVEAFCQLSSTYVPQRAGALRFAGYEALVVVGVLVGLAWLVSGAARALVRRRAGARAGGRAPGRVAALVGAAAGVGLLVGLTPLGHGERVIRTPNLVSAPALAAYRWIDRHTPRDAIVLANGFTEGVIGGVADRDGWLDGRAPYVESTAWRTQATRRLLAARRWFLRPRGAPPRPVDDVLVVRPPLAPGGSRFAVATGALRRAPGLRLVRSFDRGRVLVFRVRRAYHPPLVPSRALRPTARPLRAG